MDVRSIAALSFFASLLFHMPIATQAADTNNLDSTNDLSQAKIQAPLQSSLENSSQISLLDYAAEETRRRTLEMVNEVSNRRRLAPLFSNPQLSLRGVQVGFVNSTSGNLTFQQRDFVVVGNLPIVVSRIYDSANLSSGDFGPGWHLGFSETIEHESGQTWRYIDGNRSSHQLFKSGRSLVARRPSVSGFDLISLSGNKAILKSGELTREFRKLRDEYVLARVTDSVGRSMSFRYENGMIAAIERSDGIRVTVERDSTGRVTDISSPNNQFSRYRYTNRGNLSGAKTDTASWRYKYSNSDLLQAVVDPRRVSVLEARYDRYGRVRDYRALSLRYSFRYQENLTVVTNVLGDEANIRFNQIGITHQIQDFAGDATSIVLDSDYLPRAIVKNATEFANFSYDKSGSLLQMALLSNDRTETYDLSYTKGGKVSKVLQDGREVSTYEYDDLGNLIRSSDPLGSREYYRSDGGVLEQAAFGGRQVYYEFQSNGLLKDVSTSSGDSLSLKYDSRGRVTNSVFNQELSVAYDYGSNGFRRNAEYSDGVAVQFSYDDTANLTRISHDEPSRLKESIYTINDENQLTRIESNTGPNFDFSYDRLGRIELVSAGERRLAVEYDKASRLSQARLDGTVVFNGSGNTDIATAADSKTFESISAYRPGANIFGSLDDIFYTRSLFTYSGIVRFDQHSFRFVLPGLEILSPDYVFMSSMSRRQIPVDEFSELMIGSFFDKPSNSLFIPPEYYSVNCFICDAYILNHELLVGGSANSPTTASIGATKHFKSQATVSNCWLKYGSGDVIDHRIDFKDGSSPANQTTSGLQGTFSAWHAYQSGGAYNTSAFMECACGLFAVSTVNHLVNVPTPSCTVDFDVSSPQNFLISTAPTMPTLNASVTTKQPSDASVSWSAEVSLTAPSASCSGGPTFESTAQSGSGNSYTPNFGGFYGGTVTIEATCSKPGYASSSTTKTYEIGGTQPSDASIISYIGSSSSPYWSADLRRIGCWESSLTQFTSQNDPYFSIGQGGDVGIVQACFQRTNNFIWNWKANVDRGRTLLQGDMKNGAKNHLDAQVSAGAPSYSNSMWREEGIHRYNAGCCGSGNAYREWDSNIGVWKIVQRGGAPGYLGHVTGQSSSCT